MSAPATSPHTAVISGRCLDARWTPAGIDLSTRTSAGELQRTLLAPGDDIAFGLAGPKRCIGHQISGADETTGASDADDCGRTLCNAPATERGQCEPCATADGLPRKFKAAGPGEHAVYLASYGQGLIKVGTARWDRRVRRLTEQGAVEGLVVARGDGGEALKLEKWWRDEVGVPDRYAPGKRLAGSVMPVASSELLRHELLHLLELHRCRREAPWLPKPEQIDLPPVPVFSHQPQPRLLRDGVTIRGRVHSVCGATLVVDEGEGSEKLIAAALSGFAGFHLRALDEADYKPQQLGLFA